MSQSLAQVYLHIVYSTKHRKSFLKSKALQTDVHAYLAATLANLECPALVVGGVEDHVHALCRLGRKVTIADRIRNIKKASFCMLHDRSPALRRFAWQGGYGAFSISPSHVPALTRYIENQEEHHRTESFQDEFRRLLRKYGIAYDERYVWD